MYSNDSENLFSDPMIKHELDRIKGKMTDEEYAGFVSEFIFSQIDINNLSLSSSVILFGQNFISSFENTRSHTVKLLVLGVMRELRRTFRNSNRIYAGIEYYDSLNKKYLAKNDSLGITVTYNVLAGFYNRIGLSEKGNYYNLKSAEYLDNSEHIDSKLSISLLFWQPG